MLPSLNGLDNLVQAELVSINQIGQLQNLSGLANLDSVGIVLTIGNCSNLTSLSGLNSLRNIAGDLNISANGSLTDISAIENIEQVGGKVVISFNAMLAACNNNFLCEFIMDGFYADINSNLGACETVDSVLNACNISLDCPYNLEIHSQAALDIFRLEYPNCTHINGSLTILNSNIEEFSALGDLRHIGHKLILENNQVLTDLSDLSNLSYLGDELNIKNNNLLNNLAGLENLSDMRVISISENDQLSICNVASVCNYLRNLPINFSYYFNANNGGCNQGEVNSACNCVNDLTVMQANGIYWATESIQTAGNLTVTNYAKYNAPNVIIQPSFEVNNGRVFEISQSGCTQ